jgi:serine/threonine protein kinase
MPSQSRYFFVGPDDDPDKYRLLHSVGGGGEAELWAADIALGEERERVAVKMLRTHHSADFAAWRTRWAHQVELLRLNQHPGVVGIHCYFEGAPMHLRGNALSTADRRLYLVMNWIDGQDLRDWRSQPRGPADRAEALRYLTQIAEVLDWLHRGGNMPSGRAVVHGDLSPANVITNQDGQAVLVDFGFARIAHHVTAVPTGTPGYTAPEVISGGEYSPASDRYAFGGLAFYLLTGTHPAVEPETLLRGMTQIAQGTGQQAAVPALMQIFSADPSQRPPTGEWMRLLRAQFSTAPVHTGPIPPVAPHTSGPMGIPVTARPSWGPAATGVPRPAAGTGRGTKTLLATLAGAVLALSLTLVVTVWSVGQATPAGGTGTSRSGSAGSNPAATAQNPGTAPTQGATPPSTATQEPSGKRVPLTDLRVIGTADSLNRGSIRINKQVFPDALVPECNFGQTYHLDRDFTHLHFRIGIDDYSESAAYVEVTVAVDGQTVKSVTTKLAELTVIDVDITEGFRMDLYINGDHWSGRCPKTGLIDPYVVRK